MATRSGSNYVLDPIAAFNEKLVGIVVTAAYDDATSLILDIQGYNDKIVLIKNTGGANALDYKILASIDKGEEYDIEHTAEAALALGVQVVIEFPNYYTNIKIQVKSASGTTANIKVAATGN